MRKFWIIWSVWLVIYLGLMALLIWVIAHFVIKYW